MKWHTDALGDPKLLRASRRGVRNLVLLPWLLLFAKRAEDGGALTVNGEPAEPDDILDALPFDGYTPDDITALLASLVDLGILMLDRAGRFVFVRWPDRQGPPSHSREANRERVAKHRRLKREAQREAELGLGNNPCNTDGCNAGNKTEVEVEVEVEVEEEVEEEKKKPRARARGRQARQAVEVGTVAPNGKRPGKPTWLTPFMDDWKAAYGGTVAGGRLATALKDEYKRLGEAKLRAAWQSYLVATAADYASPSKFASTIGQWTGERPRMGTKHIQNAVVIAKWSPEQESR